MEANGNTTQATAALYLRKSNIDERAGDNRSITDQRHDLERLAERHGLQIVTEYVEAVGTSASHIKKHVRPEYDRALAEMGSKYQVLLGWRMNRLLRAGMSDMGHLLDIVESTGGRVITDDGTDTNQPGMRSLLAMLSEQDRAYVQSSTEATRRGKEGQRRRGEYQGGSVPFGWQAVRRLNEPTQVEQDPDAVPVIREMVERIIDGATLGEVCKWANDAGHRTSNGAAWTASTLTRVIKSPHLIGHLRQLDDVHRDDKGNPVQVVEPILTEGQFVRVARVLASRRRGGTGHRGKNNGRLPASLLGGMISCAECGRGMVRYGRVSGNDKTYTYYRCQEAGCGFTIRQLELDALVAGEALAFLARQDKDSPIVDEVARRWMARYTPDQMTKRQELEDEAEAVEGRLQKLRTDYYDAGKMTDDEFDEREERLQGRVDDLRAEVGTMPAPTADLSAIQSLVESNDDPDVDPVSEGSAWANLEDHERRDIIKLLVDTVTIERRAKPTQDIETADHGGRVSIEFATPSNVVELGARTDRRRRSYSTAPKVTGFEGAARATVAATA